MGVDGFKDQTTRATSVGDVHAAAGELALPAAPGPRQRPAQGLCWLRVFRIAEVLVLVPQYCQYRFYDLAPDSSARGRYSTLLEPVLRCVGSTVEYPCKARGLPTLEAAVTLTMILSPNIV